MFFLQVAIVFWVVGFVLAFTLGAIIHLLNALTGTFFQVLMQVFNDRRLT